MTGSCCMVARRPSSRSDRSAIQRGSPRPSQRWRLRGFGVVTDDRRWLPHRAVDPRPLAARRSACRPGSGDLGGRIGARRRRRLCVDPGGAARDLFEAGCGGHRLLARGARLYGDRRRRGGRPLGHGSTVWMQELDEAKSLRHAMRVDVSVAREHLPGRLAAALAAGGRVVWESDEHWTLADRAGNRVDITPGPTEPPSHPPTGPTQEQCDDSLPHFVR